MDTNTAHDGKVSVVIVTYDSMPPLEDCLKSIKTGTNGTSLEVINVDNSSCDNSPEVVKQYFPDATIIRNPTNVGFAKACNIAAQKATGDYLLFLNPDVRIDKYTIERLLEVCRSNEKAGAAVGRMRFPDGSFQATCRQLPHFRNMFYSRGSVFSKFLGNGYKYTLPDYETTTPVPAAAGTMMMVPSKLFHEVGGFDQRFFMFMEDVDLCQRLGSKGYHTYFVPSAGAVHLWGKGSKASKFKRNLYHHYTVWRYFIKHYPSVRSYVLLPFMLLLNLMLVTILPVSQPVNRK